MVLRMKGFFRFLFSLAACFAAALVLFFAAGTYVWIGLPSYYEHNYQKGLVKQYRALQKSDPTKPKILVIGDSSMAFSVDSAQLSKATGMPCYTLGMQGGMGKEYVFDLAKPYINEGDIVIHPYTGYNAGYFGTDLILLSVENEPDLYFDYLFKHPFEMLARLKDRCVVKLVATAKGETEGEGVDFYKAEAFDETGNMTYYRPAGRYASSLEESDHYFYYAGMYSEQDIDKVNAYTAYCKEKGATFLLTSGVVYRDHVDNTEEELEKFEAWFRSVFDAPLIVDKWSDNHFEKKLMYDTAIHANSNGMKVYTQNLYEDLLPYLAR